jgi:adenylosuccinate synthase
MDGLPAQARDYVDFVSRSLSVAIAAIAVGPAREQTIVLKPALSAPGSGR